MIVIKLRIVYKDDKEEVFDCCSAPYIDDNWIAIYPYDDPTARKNINIERISEIEWHYEAMK